MQTLFTPAVQTADMGPLKPNPAGNSVSAETPESFARVFEASQKEATPKPETPKPEAAVTNLEAPVIPQPEQTPSSAETPSAPLFIQASIQSLLLNLPEPENRVQSEIPLPVETDQAPQITDLLLKGLEKDQDVPVQTVPTEEVQVSSAQSTIQEPSPNTTEKTELPAPEQSSPTTEQAVHPQSLVAASPAAEMASLPATAASPPTAPIPQSEQKKEVEQLGKTDAPRQTQTVSQAVVATPATEQKPPISDVAAKAEPEVEQGLGTESENGLEKGQDTDSEVRTFGGSPTASIQQASSDLPVLKQTAQMAQLATVPAQAQAIQTNTPSLQSVLMTRQDNLEPQNPLSAQGSEPLQAMAGHAATAPSAELAPSLQGAQSPIPLMPESPSIPKELALPSEAHPRPATEPENLRFAPLGERIRLLRQAGQNQMRLNLQPAELGRVSLQIVQKEQELHLHIFTDTVMAKELWKAKSANSNNHSCNRDCIYSNVKLKSIPNTTSTVVRVFLRNARPNKVPKRAHKICPLIGMKQSLNWT
jgi:hypothetical protein